jgi:hypothetical protein
MLRDAHPYQSFFKLEKGAHRAPYIEINPN